jgi:hypothetical protein
MAISVLLDVDPVPPGLFGQEAVEAGGEIVVRQDRRDPGRDAVPRRPLGRRPPQGDLGGAMDPEEGRERRRRYEERGGLGG